MTRQVNTGTRESFSHPRAPAYRGRGREEGARLRVNERSDTKIRSDRAGIRPPDGGAGPVSRWIARCSLGPLPLPQRNCSVLREASRPTDEETSDKRRGTVGNREMGRTDPWNGSWANVSDRRPSNRSNFVSDSPSSSSSSSSWNSKFCEGFVASLNYGYTYFGNGEILKLSKKSKIESCWKLI